MSEGEGEFAGRSVLITGAAGGLGAPAALAFASAGASITVVDWDQEGGERLLSMLRPLGGDHQLVVADLGRLEAMAVPLETLAAERAIDILVNNAAIYPSRPLEDFTLSEFREVQEVNVAAAFACAQAVLPHMKAKRWGRIINVSSITRTGGWPGIAPYVTSKAALVGMARALARELGPYGITANSVCPGAFPTEAEKIQGDPTAYEALVLERQAIKRRGGPDDFANALFFFASARSGFVTGQSLNVDGGWIMN